MGYGVAPEGALIYLPNLVDIWAQLRSVVGTVLNQQGNVSRGKEFSKYFKS